ncbi:MAG: hypothetical protein ACK4V1_08950, partial [Burkholderiaceae bacterium]
MPRRCGEGLGAVRDAGGALGGGAGRGNEAGGEGGRPLRKRVALQTDRLHARFLRGQRRAEPGRP